MQLSPRTYLIAGIAVASTGVIAAAPVIAPMPLPPLPFASAQPNDDSDGGGLLDGIDSGGDLIDDGGFGSGRGDDGPGAEFDLGTDVDVDLDAGDLDVGDLDVGDLGTLPSPVRSGIGSGELDPDSRVTSGRLTGSRSASPIRVVSTGGSAADDIARVVIQIPARVNPHPTSNGTTRVTPTGRTSSQLQRTGGLADPINIETSDIARVVIQIPARVNPHVPSGDTSQSNRNITLQGLSSSLSRISRTPSRTTPSRDNATALERTESRVAPTVVVGTTTPGDMTEELGGMSVSISRTVGDARPTPRNDLRRGIRSTPADPVSASMASTAKKSAAQAATASSERARED